MGESRENVQVNHAKGVNKAEIIISSLRTSESHGDLPWLSHLSAALNAAWLLCRTRVVCGMRSLARVDPARRFADGYAFSARAVLYESVGWQNRLGWGTHKKLLRWSPSPNQPSNMPPPNDSVGLTCNASADFTSMCAEWNRMGSVRSRLRR